MIGIRRVPCPATKRDANGSSRYPRETALSLETAASVSVDWMARSLRWAPGPLASPLPPNRAEPLPRPPRERGPPREVKRFGICGADML